MYLINHFFILILSNIFILSSSLFKSLLTSYLSQMVVDLFQLSMNCFMFTANYSHNSGNNDNNDNRW